MEAHLLNRLLALRAARDVALRRQRRATGALHRGAELLQELDSPGQQGQLGLWCQELSQFLAQTGAGASNQHHFAAELHGKETL